MDYREKQIQLMEVAEQLFATQGFVATSIRDIARTSKMNSSMISYYFGSKEKLLKAILEYRVEATSEFLERILSLDLPHGETINQLLNLYVDSVFEKKYYYALIMQLQLLEGENDILNHFYELRERNTHLFKTTIEAGQQNQQFKSDIDLSLLSSSIAGTINHFIINQKYYRHLHCPEDIPAETFNEQSKKQLRTYLDQLLKLFLLK